MNSPWVIFRPVGFCGAVFLWLLWLSGCQYDVPITSRATRKVERALLGNWRSLDGKEELKVRRLDDSTYVVYYDGDLFRVYHSDIGDTPFASIQDLNSNDRKYAFVAWRLSDDGNDLSLRSVSDKLIPKGTKNSATIVTLLTKNAGNPELFGEAIEFRKDK